jgi:hypothetical protein
MAYGPAGSQATGGSAAGGSPGDSGGGASGSAGGGAGGSPTAGGASGGQPGGQPSGNLTFGRPRPVPPGASGSGKPGSSANGGQGGGTGGSATAGRGNNWGLPGSRGRVTAVTRPIHITVLRDRIVLLPDQGDNRPPLHLPISADLTPAEVDRFVATVQREIQGWGLAVEDGFWKPQLLMEVAPDAEPQSQQLQTALQGSGFDLQRKLR